MHISAMITIITAIMETSYQNFPSFLPSFYLYSPFPHWTFVFTFFSCAWTLGCPPSCGH